MSLILTKIAEIFDKPITETLVEVYTDALEGYSKDQIAAAAKQLMRTSEFFPRPANFIKLIDPPEDKIVVRRNDDAIAASAWDTFIRWLEGKEKLESSDPVRMAGEIIGGKGRFALMTYEQINFYRGDFKDAYLTILNEQDRGEALKEIGAPEKIGLGMELPRGLLDAAKSNGSNMCVDCEIPDCAYKLCGDDAAKTQCEAAKGEPR